MSTRFDVDFKLGVGSECVVYAWVWLDWCSHLLMASVSHSPVMQAFHFRTWERPCWRRRPPLMRQPRGHLQPCKLRHPHWSLVHRIHRQRLTRSVVWSYSLHHAGLICQQHICKQDFSRKWSIFETLVWDLAALFLACLHVKLSDMDQKAWSKQLIWNIAFARQAICAFKATLFIFIYDNFSAWSVEFLHTSPIRKLDLQLVQASSIELIKLKHWICNLIFHAGLE